jgi:hypothetical protein
MMHLATLRALAYALCIVHVQCYAHDKYHLHHSYASTDSSLYFYVTVDVMASAGASTTVPHVLYMSVK